MALSAPTGRAAKRLSETTGRPAGTLHRLLEWRPTDASFARNVKRPIEADVLVVDEASMLDVRLAADLVEALTTGTKLVLVGDVDQLPSVGPGAVLADLIASGRVPTVRLTEVFRQAPAEPDHHATPTGSTTACCPRWGRRRRAARPPTRATSSSSRRTTRSGRPSWCATWW